MSRFVNAFIEGCATCQATKKAPSNPVPLKPNEIPESPWETITMDFITDLPESHGYDSLFVVVDRFSKAAILTPCNKTITAPGTSEIFMENVWKRTGLPKTIISDRGPQFVVAFTREVWKKLKVNINLSTAFHPQTDGETERVNQELEQYLRVFCNAQQDNWVDLIPYMEFAHNARAHEATGRSPFEIWYGFQPEFAEPVIVTSKVQSAQERLEFLRDTQKEVTAALKVAAKIMKHKGPLESRYSPALGD